MYNPLFRRRMLATAQPCRPKTAGQGNEVRIERWLPTDCRPVIARSTLCALLLLSAPAMAQTPPQLVTPIPATALTGASAAQTAAIDRLRQRPTTGSLSLVTVHLDALHGNSTQITAPGLPAMTLAKRNEEVRSPTDFTWYGTLSGAPGQAILVVHNGNITGSIQDQTTLYRIEPVGDGMHALIKVDADRFPPEEESPSTPQKQRSEIRQPLLAGVATAAAPVGIDVMVPYTPAAKAAVGDIAALIQLAVAEANQSYVNSGIFIKLNLVDSFELPYSEDSKSFETIVTDFAANPTAQAHRNSSHADLSALIIDQPTANLCGRADLPIMATPATAFAVVEYDCATGYYSFAHELGHLMGARHDENHDASTTPYAYGHGYEHPGTPSFRTIMAYACIKPVSCQPRIQYWSSPNVKYNNTPTGTAATNDNVRVLNATALTVAAFATPPIVVTGDAVQTNFSGRSGGHHYVKEKTAAEQQQALSTIGGREQSDDPCDLLMFYKDFTAAAKDQGKGEWTGCSSRDGQGNSRSYLAPLIPDGYFVTGMAVVLNKDNDKVKGFWIKGSPAACLAGLPSASIPLAFGGTQTIDCSSGAATKEDAKEHVNAIGNKTNKYDSDWEKQVFCPSGTVAIGIALNIEQGFGNKQVYSGLALRCRPIKLG